LKAKQPDLDQAAAVVNADLVYRAQHHAVPTGFKIDEDKEAELRTKARETQQALNRYNAGTSYPWEQGGREGFENDAKKASDALIEYEKKRQAKEDSDAAIKAETDLLKENEAARDKNRKAIETETAALEKEKVTQGGKDATNKQRSAFDIVDRAGGFANADNIISQGTAAVEAYQHGQKLSGEQMQQIAAMRALFEAVGGNSIAIINILKQSLAHHVSLAAEIAALKQQFANLKSSQVKVSTTGQ
jgi:hypothetical protein